MQRRNTKANEIVVIVNTKTIYIEFYRDAPIPSEKA
jgi:hypothetical protein